jgi:hypothetical protein
MRCIVTGGNRGLGLSLVHHYKAQSLSRSNGHDIIKNVPEIANLSLDCDLFINNAFDGPFQESWANFGQVKLLWEVANLWRLNNKKGHIINIGSTGTESISSLKESFETYRVAKVALKEHSLQWTESFKKNEVLFKTTLLTLDRLDTELSRSRDSWTGNGIDVNDVCNFIDLIIATKGNTCIGEIVSWVNFNYTS